MTDRGAGRALDRGAIEARAGPRGGLCRQPGTYDQKHIDRIGAEESSPMGGRAGPLAHQQDEWIGCRTCRILPAWRWCWTISERTQDGTDSKTEPRTEQDGA